jgi:aryl-alcohol dehydrogenase-like predicted oxidoreductase
LMWSVEESLRLLRRDHIDILMIHEPDRPGHDRGPQREGARLEHGHTGVRRRRHPRP